MNAIRDKAVAALVRSLSKLRYGKDPRCLVIYAYVQ